MDKNKLYTEEYKKYDPAIEYFNDLKRGVYSVSNSFELVDNKMMYQPQINDEYLTVHDKLGTLNTVNTILPNVDAFGINSVTIDNSRTAINAFTSLSDSFIISKESDPNVLSIPLWQNEILVDNKFFSPGSIPISTPSTLQVSRNAVSIDQLPGVIQGTTRIDPFAEMRMGVADGSVKYGHSPEASLGTVIVDSLSSFAIKSSIVQATEYTVLAEKSLLAINSDNLGHTIGLMPNTNGNLVSAYDDLSIGYSSLITSFNNNPLSYIDLHPNISKCIPSEYYLNANLWESISIPDYSAIDEDVDNKFQLENENSLSEYLPMLGTEYVSLWQGAIEAYNSNNTDRIRHFSISVRELFTHVLNKLAPDEEIAEWSDTKSFYHEGKPTRGAKLHYISREVSSEYFKDFIAKDVKATIELIQLLNRGAHRLNSGFTENQLKTLKTRAESTLKFILEVHFNSNSRN